MEIRRIMTVSDDPDWAVQEALMAKAKALHERATLIGRWLDEGHIAAHEAEGRFQRVQIEDEIFTDPRDQFPTENLIARVQLALHAGRTNKNLRPKITDFDPRAPVALDHASDAFRYGRFGKSRWEAQEQAYHNVAQITRGLPRR